MKITVVLYMVLMSAVGFTQMLDNSNGYAFTDQPFFNTSFIKANKIDTVRGKFIVRKPGKSFKRTEYIQEFVFDEAGQLRSQRETFPDDGSSDTTATHYAYTKDGLLMQIRKRTLDGFVQTDFVHDSLGRIIQETVSKLYFESNGASRATMLNNETYKYIDLESQWRRVSFNSYGKPFLEEIFYEDEDGYLTQKKDIVKMTSKRFIHEYEYDDNGYLASMRKREDKSDVFLEEITFHYDEYGNLSEKQIFNKGEHVTDIQIIYNNKTGLLSSIVTRSMTTGILAILQFKEYTYFD